MTKQFDDLLTQLPDFKGQPIANYELPDYMYSDPIHYSKEWFKFIENSVSDMTIAGEYKQLIQDIMKKQHGVDVRLSLAIFVYIISHGFTLTLAEFEKLSKEIRSRAENLEEEYKDLIEEWKNTLNGVTVDSELINARIDLHGIVYKTLKERLDDMQSSIEDLTPTETVFTIKHNQNGLVPIRVVTGINGLGIAPLGQEPTGLGGSEIMEIASKPVYLSRNELSVLVPLKYKMKSPTITRIASNEYLLVEGIRTLIITIGDENKANVETTMEFTSTLDYKNKVANSVVENPNIFYYGAGEWTDLKKPNDPSWGEFSQRHVDDVSQLDNRLFEALRYNQNVLAQSLLRFNILEDFKRKKPSMFNDLTLIQQVEQMKKNVVKVAINVDAKGSNSAGNKVGVRIFQDDLRWNGVGTNVSDKIARIRASFTYSGNITNAGKVDLSVHAYPSNGKIASALYIDYANLEYTATVPFAPIK